MPNSHDVRQKGAVSPSGEAGREQSTRLRGNWLGDAIVAGFVATGASTIALILGYLISAGFGDQRGDPLRQWMWGLTHNPVVSFSQASPAVAVAIHVLVGLLFSLVYARFFAGRVPGPAWWVGILWGLIVGVLSLVVFLPAVGAGILGLGLNAGPLPLVGNLLLHAVYGFTLGQLYDARSDRPDTGEDATYDEPLEAAAMAHSGAFSAAGIVGGIVVGSLLGAILAIVVKPSALDDPTGWTIAMALGGVLAGGAVGAVVGSFSGLPQTPADPAEAELGADPFEQNVLPYVIIPALALAIAAIVVALGSVLLTLAPSSKFLPVAVALVATIAVALGGWLLSRRQRSDVARTTVSHSGH